MSATVLVVAIAGGAAFIRATVERGRVAATCGHRHATYARAEACDAKLTAPKAPAPKP